jgi:hypothetical protein
MLVAPTPDRSFPTSVTRESATPPTTASASRALASPFVEVMRSLGHEAERGEAMVRGVLWASSARQTFGPTELLALQAGIYRYGETVDLAAKLVDKAGTDVKTVLQGQQ